MANQFDHITDLMPFDRYVGRRTITGLGENITIVKAWVAVKRDPRDEDEDALIFKTLTTAGEINVGQIETDGSVDGTSTSVFIFTPEEAGLLKYGYEYDWAFKVLASDGEPMTPFSGKIRPLRPVIKAVS